MKSAIHILFRHLQSKSIFVLLVALLVTETCCEDKNINKLLNNQVIVSRQIMCVLEKSPCDQLGRQLKDIFCAYKRSLQFKLCRDGNNYIDNDVLPNAALPEVIQRNCRNCSPQQAQNAQKLTNFLQNRYPDVWAMLLKKYQNA